MRSIVVVPLAVLSRRSFQLGPGVKVPRVEEPLKRLVGPFNLALGLRVVRSSRDRPDPQTAQEGHELGRQPDTVEVVGGAVVGMDHDRPPIFFKCKFECTEDFDAILGVRDSDAEIEPSRIVDDLDNGVFLAGGKLDRERVRLPPFIGERRLESAVACLRSLALVAIGDVIGIEHPGDRGPGRHPGQA